MRKKWVALLAAFLLSQLMFIALEGGGWIPNLREINGTLLGRIAESATFIRLFSYYETTHFNIFTAFFCMTLFVPGVLGAIIDNFKKKPIHKYPWKLR
ncbi:YfzA family protein [Lysinibacillus sp. 54212]|uniref:YfzA family protein n=1 Tax=Lysinibacillus sp. 54212 TaxID=3119829 RepID=UPI002FC9D6D2